MAAVEEALVTSDNTELLKEALITEVQKYPAICDKGSVLYEKKPAEKISTEMKLPRLWDEHVRFCGTSKVCKT